MPNMSPERVKMPEQPIDERVKNFDEVSLGYTEAMAVEEAQRCLNCKFEPCRHSCPVHVEIPKFINLISQGKFLEAHEIISHSSSLPGVCGRVCPQELQCEGSCVRGRKGEAVAIGRLERFAADYYRRNNTDEITKPKQKPFKVAVIGSGPAGLSCAGVLVKYGYKTVIFEAFHEPGGVLVYGIPQFILPKEIVAGEIDALVQMGAEIKTNTVVGEAFTLDNLLGSEGFDAVFIATGAGYPLSMGIEGENLNGVYPSSEFLTKVNAMDAQRFPEVDNPVRIGKRVAVIGGGNVAMDAARCALRLGAEHVFIVYRRTQEEMPARLEEIFQAKAEGIEFMFLKSPAAFKGDLDGNLVSMECVSYELGEADESGRCSPVEIKNSNHSIDIDTAIIAIGQTVSPITRKLCSKLQTNHRGNIWVDESTNSSSVDGVFAGGDVTTGPATVIKAMGAGRRAGEAIHRYLLKKAEEKEAEGNAGCD